MASRTALVTAGAGGIGLAIARRLRDDGFRVVVTDVDDVAGARCESEGIEFRHADAADESSVRAALATVGTVHTLVNNVGVRGATGNLWEIPISDFRTTLEVNTVSHVLTAQLVIPGMIGARQGCIVMISSGAARTGAVGRSPYGLSKWALLGLTKSLANELGEFGIRANAVLPGMMAGERFDGSVRLHAEAEGVDPEVIFERMMGKAKIKRLIEPEEIAAAVSYLAGDLGSGVTGTFLDVNAGVEG